jgi:DNA topoisomerase-1
MPHLLCERCDDFYLLRDGAAGIFLAASQFPKHRETRAPTVSEIVAVKDQLDPKYRFLADAPIKDHEGRPTIVRFARKTKEQYVTSEVDRKTTGWRADYRDRKWVETIPTPKPKKRKATKVKGASRKKAAARKPAARKKPAKKKAAKKKVAKKVAG